MAARALAAPGAGGAPGLPGGAPGTPGAPGEAAGGADAIDEVYTRGGRIAPVTGPASFCTGLPQWKDLFRSAALSGPLQGQLPELVLDATVNRSGAPLSVQAICLASGRLALGEDDWRQLGLRPTHAIPLPDGRKVYALESVPGTSYVIDTLAQTISIDAPPAAFEGASLDARSKPDGPQPKPPRGAYLSYDGNVSYGGGVLDYGAQLSGTVFGPWGLLYANATASGVAHGAFSAVRGDTYWQLPMPNDLTVLTVGDDVGVGGAWSRPVRFLGVRYARDFETRPGYITFPLPSINGSAALPSTVSVLVNNEQRVTADVPAGPFQINNIPIMTGSGQMQLVVTDALGRQTVVTQNYYTPPQLLAVGLSDFSYEAGFERLDYGYSSFDYGHFVADATYRRGLTNWLTGEARAEAEPDRGALGAAFTARVGVLGSVDGAIAGAVGDGGRVGGDYVLGFQTIGRTAGFTVNLQHFDRGWRPYAWLPGETLARDQATAGGGFRIRGIGAFNYTYVYQSEWNGPRSEFVNAGWSRSFGLLNLSLSANRDLLRGTWSVGFGLGFSLPGHTSVSSNVVTGSTGTDATAQASSPSPVGPGVGWAVRTDYAARSVDGSLVWNAPDAVFRAEAYGGAAGAAGRLGIAGSFGMVDTTPFVSRPVNSGFAIVRVADLPNVPVMLWNQTAALTGAHGLALITGLGAYLDNKISIDPDSLPIDVEVNGDAVVTRLWPRTGVFVDLPVRRTRAALVRLRLADGSDAPLGASVKRPDGPEAVVGDGGQVWLTDLVPHNHLTLTWYQGSCEAEVDTPAGLAFGAEVGPVVCVEDHPAAAPAAAAADSHGADSVAAAPAQPLPATEPAPTLPSAAPEPPPAPPALPKPPPPAAGPAPAPAPEHEIRWP